MSDRHYSPGVVSAALATLSALAVLVGAVLFGFSRCTHPAPIQMIVPATSTVGCGSLGTTA